MAAPLKDFGSVLRAVFRFARYASYGLILVTAWFLAMRLAEGFRFFADIHPALGWLFLATVLAALAWFVGRPVVRFLRVPVALKPPRLPEPSARAPRHLVKHLHFVERYVLALPKNPEWGGTAAEVEAVAAQCRALRERAERATPAELPALTLEMGTLERRSVGGLLAPLDVKATAIIRAEALGVGVATAVSFNGTVDAFLVLWRNCNLVSRLANLYYGRPGPRGSLSILRDVSVATLASAYLQDLSEAAGSAIGGVLGKTAGVLAPSVLDGAMNAVITARIGYLAKARCRAFSAWTERTRSQVIRDVAVEAASISTGLVTDLVRTVGGGLLRLPGKLFGAVGSTVSGWFRREPNDGGETAPA
jgi:putative membrane protein